MLCYPAASVRSCLLQLSLFSPLVSFRTYLLTNGPNNLHVDIELNCRATLDNWYFVKVGEFFYLGFK